MKKGSSVIRIKNHGGSVSLIVLAALCVVFFWKVLVAGSDRILGSYDILHTFYYLREFTKESLLRGAIPKWNPYEYCGFPFAADPNNVVFYPLNKLFLFLPTTKAIGLNFVSHIFFAGAGTLFFARTIGIRREAAFAAAVSYMFSGYFIDRMFAGHEMKVMCSAYLPWIFLCFEKAAQNRNKAWAVLGGVLLGLQVLAGTGQIVFYTGLLLAVYAVAKSFSQEGAEKRELLLRNLAYVLLIGIEGAAISAIQTLPAIELVPHSARSGATLQFARLGSFPPLNFLHFLTPYLIVGRARPHWEYTCYMGIVPLAMAVATIMVKRDRETLPFAAVGACALAIMMAASNPVFPWMAHIIPPLKLFKFHSRALVGLIFSLAILAGIGWEKCFSDTSAGSKKLRIGLAVVCASFGIISMAVVALLLTGKAPIGFNLFRLGDVFGVCDTSWVRIVSPFHRRIMVPVAVIFVSFLVSLALLRTTHRYLSVALAALVVADLFVTHAGHIRLVDAAYVTRPDRIVEFLKSDNDPRYYRVWLQDKMFFPSRANYFKVFNVMGYAPLAPTKYFAQYISHLTGVGVRNNSLYALDEKMFSRTEPFLQNILNVKYFGYKPANARKAVLMKTENFSPRAWFVSRYAKGSPQEFLDSGVDPRDTVFLHEDPPQWLENAPAAEAAGTVKIHSYSNEELRLSVEAPVEGFVVLSECYYPGWKAEIDGEYAEVLRGDYFLRVVPVPRGRHMLRVYFAPTSLLAGKAVTALACLVIGVWFVGYKSKRR